MKLIRTLLLCLFSAFLLILSFPRPELAYFAWFSFVPLFAAIDKLDRKSAFLFSYLTGVIFFLGTLYWVGYVNVFGLVALVLYLGLYFGIFGLLVNRLHSSFGALILVPCFWVSLEYLRSRLFSGFGWPVLGYSQYLNLSFIQIAKLTGAYGVSFLIIMVNVLIFQGIRGARIILKKEVSSRGRPNSKLLINLSIVLLILISVFIYGRVQLSQRTAARIKVGLVQANVPQQEKWDPAFKYLILEKYQALTRLVSLQRPDIIIWPETAIPGYLLDESEVLGYVVNLAREVGIPLLIGSPFLHNSNEVYNSAFLVSGKGKILARYDKIHLVPFGEYIPLDRIFSFVAKIDKRAAGDHFSHGRDYTIFKMPTSDGQEPGASFGVLICFEDIFPGLVREFVRKGADFMVNITNDAWFGTSGAPYQHTQALVLRAVENNIGIARSANTGISCIIEPSGKIARRISDAQGNHIFITGYLAGGVALLSSPTFYTRFGDLFTYLCILISIGWVILDKVRNLLYNAT